MSFAILLLLLFHFLIFPSESMMNFVRCCPGNEVSWSKRENDSSCQKGKQYHCMQTRDGRFAEFCAVISIISNGMCPVTENGSQIDGHSKCFLETRQCPSKDVKYVSNQLYKYPGCFNTCDETTISTKVSQLTKSRTTIHDLQNILESSDRRISEIIVTSSTDKADGNTWLVDTTNNLLTSTSQKSDEVGDSSSNEYTMTVLTYGGIAGLVLLIILAIVVCIIVPQWFKSMRKSQCKSQEIVPLCSVTSSSSSRGPLPEVPKIVITEESEYDCAYDDNMVLKEEEIKFRTCASSLDVAYESPVLMQKYESLKGVCKETLIKRNVYDSLENIQMTPSDESDVVNRIKKSVSI